MTDRQTKSPEIVVVGGGLAGLAAAAYLARAGRSVVVFEKAGAPGGRARTRDQDGFLFNAGGHALYRGGRGAAVLRELGVSYGGGFPGLRGGFAYRADTLHTLPIGLASLLTTGLLSLRGKLQAARVLGALPRIDPAPWRRRSLREWIESAAASAEVRELLAALVRLTTYGHDSERISAGAAIEQLQLGQKGVLYLNDGWQTLVDGLRQTAIAAGAELVTEAPVEAVERDRTVAGVRLADGRRVRSRAVVVAAGGPAEARALVEGGDDTSLAACADQAIPVRVACLDLALARLPRPRALFALGIDAPVYASVHSAVARLAPPGGALLHTFRYRETSRPSAPEADRRELEGVLDRLQPGWREHVVHRQFLPDMTVSYALPAVPGESPGRPGPQVPEVPGLLVAGDWVGEEGLLADASLASARHAAALAVAHLEAAVTAA